MSTKQSSMTEKNKRPASGSFAKLMSSPLPTEPEKEKEMEGQEDESTQADKGARTHTHEHVNQHASAERELRERILIRRRLSSFTFRFQAEELEALDQVTDEVNKNNLQKTSKNDVIRLALNWLLRDYEENRDQSTLAKVLKYT